MRQPKITKRAADWMMTTDQCRVLHDFEQVVTFINDRAEVISVHTAEIGMGPFSLQVNQEQLQIVKSIVVGDEGGGPTPVLRKAIGPALFGPDEKACQLWNARLDWSRFTADMLADIPHELPDDIDHAMCRLHQAIVEKNRAGVEQASKTIIGRGIGLTPTGDDVLMGTIFALHVLGWERDMMQIIGEQAAGSTTSLSAAFLRAAVAGEATEPWHNLLAGKANALENLLAVGATSGKDAWIGFVKMLQVARGRMQTPKIGNKSQVAG